MMKEEELISRLLELNCPYLSNGGPVEQHRSWIKGMSSSGRGEEREGFLRWILSTISPAFSSVPLEEGLVSLGLFTTNEDAKSFVVGVGRSDSQEMIWRLLLLLLNLPGSSEDQLLIDSRHKAEFKDVLAADVSLRNQRTGRFRALSYQLERDVRNSPALFQPTRPLLESLLTRGQEERTSLLLHNLTDTQTEYRTEETSRPACVDSFLAESSRFLGSSQQFRSKFASELKPLLMREGACGGAPPDRPELRRCGQSSQVLRRLLDGQSVICTSVHSWRESALKLADLVEKKKGDGREKDKGVVLNLSLTAASL